MWAQLALGATKALMDKKNNDAFNQSQIINQKYSNWTGQKGDFSRIGQNTGLGTMAQAAMGGYLADQQGDKLAALADKQAGASTQAALDDDANYYAKLSQDPNSVGVTAIEPKRSIASTASPISSSSAFSAPQSSPVDAVANNPNLMIFPERQGQNQFNPNPWSQLLGGR